MILDEFESSSTEDPIEALKAESREKFEKLFSVDTKQQREKLKSFMLNFSSNPPYWLENFETGKRKLASDFQRLLVKHYFQSISSRYNLLIFKGIKENFVRLEQEIAIKKDLDERKPVMIRHFWRIGKTTMLESVERKFENSIYFDMRCSNTTSALPNWKKNLALEEVAKFISKKESSLIEVVKAEMVSTQRDSFDYLNMYLERKNEIIFLALDEVSILHKKENYLEYLASLKNLSQIRIAIVIHKSCKNETLIKEVFRDYTTHAIRTLTLEETTRIIRKPLEETEVNFTDGAVQRIHALSGGRPWEIHHICRAITDNHTERGKMKFLYHTSDIDEFMAKITTDGYILLPDANFRSITDIYLDVYHNLNNEEQRIIRRLLQENTIAFQDCDSLVAEALVETTYVLRDDKNQVYRIGGEFFRDTIKNFLGLDR